MRPSITQGTGSNSRSIKSLAAVFFVMCIVSAGLWECPFFSRLSYGAPSKKCDRRRYTRRFFVEGLTAVLDTGEL